MSEASETEDTSVTQGFQHQDRILAYPFTKSAKPQQHGQKPPETPLQVREPRSYKPRPGH